MRLVLDTNVVVSGLRSRRGASFGVLELLGTDKFQPCISVPLALEYEDVLLRQAGELGLSASDIGNFIDYLCRIADRHKVFYLWRPILKDPDDDMVLELAISANCSAIVTYNKRHFEGVRRFGIEIMDARELLQQLGELP